VRLEAEMWATPKESLEISMAGEMKAVKTKRLNIAYFDRKWIKEKG
jgi:hypothetical protein